MFDFSKLKGVFHVGASTGQDTGDQSFSNSGIRFYDSHDLNVVWIEPIKEVFDVLESNIADYPKQHAFNYLITDQDDQEYPFHVANNNGESSSILDLTSEILETYPSIHYVSSRTLLSKTVSTLILENQIDMDDYDYLALDTQGSELLVMKGCRDFLRSFKYINTEVADYNAYDGCCLLSEVDEYLETMGYKRVDLIPWNSGNAAGDYYNALYERDDTVEIPRKYYTTAEAFTDDNYFRPFRSKPVVAKNWNLSEHFKKYYSQTWEDSVLEYLFSVIPARHKYYVEFGGAIGQCHGNTTYLRTQGWDGLLMDGSEYEIGRSGDLDVKLEWITSDNIMGLFEKYDVPEDFDLLSIDIDGDELHIFDAIDTEKYRPSVIVCEYNPGMPNHIPLTILEGRSDFGNNPIPPRIDNHPKSYHGCNINAIYTVAQRKGYSVVTSVGVNVIMVRNDYADQFTIPELHELCVPPYMQQETHRFYGPQERFDDRYVWEVVK